MRTVIGGCVVAGSASVVVARLLPYPLSRSR